MNEWRRGRVHYSEEILKRVLEYSEPTRVILNNLALIYVDQLRYEEAEPLLRQAVLLCEEEFGTEHFEYALNLSNLGIALEKLGQAGEAADLHERALRIYERVLPRDHLEISRSINNLAIAYLLLKRTEEAGALLRRGLTLSESVNGAHHLETAMSHHNLGHWHESRGELKEASEAYAQAVVIKDRVRVDSPSLATSLTSLGVVLTQLGHLEDAEQVLERAATINASLFGHTHPQTKMVLSKRVMVLSRMKRHGDAAILLESMISHEASNSSELIALGSNLGAALRQCGRDVDAIQQFERALDVARSSVGTIDDVLNLGSQLASTYLSVGNVDAAKALLRELVPHISGEFQEPQLLADSLSELGGLAEENEDFEDAAHWFSASITVLQRLAG